MKGAKVCPSTSFTQLYPVPRCFLTTRLSSSEAILTLKLVVLIVGNGLQLTYMCASTNILEPSACFIILHDRFIIYRTQGKPSCSIQHYAGFQSNWSRVLILPTGSSPQGHWSNFSVAERHHVLQKSSGRGLELLRFAIFHFPKPGMYLTVLKV